MIKRAADFENFAFVTFFNKESRCLSILNLYKEKVGRVKIMELDVAGLNNVVKIMCIIVLFKKKYMQYKNG